MPKEVVYSLPFVFFLFFGLHNKWLRHSASLGLEKLFLNRSSPIASLRTVVGGCFLFYALGFEVVMHRYLRNVNLVVL